MKRKWVSCLVAGCAAITLLLPGVAKADSIVTFDFSGTAIAQGTQNCDYNCPFSGSLTIDTTSGTIESGNVAFYGESSLGAVDESLAFNGGWTVTLFNKSSNTNLATLDFTTTTPSSLVGFDGGNLYGGVVLSNEGSLLYVVDSGTITAPVAPTPEPSSLALLGTGSLGFAGVVRRKVLRS